MTSGLPSRSLGALTQNKQPAFVSAPAWHPSAFRYAPRRRLGLTGLEPVTLRLSSACSNQLSYRPEKLAI